MPTSIKIAKNTLAQFFGRLITALVTVLITFLLIRSYGTDYGNFIAILTYISLFFVFADFGLNAVYIKRVVHDQQKEDEIFKNLLALRFFSSLAIIFIALALLSFLGHPPFVKLAIIIGLPIIVLQGLFFSAGAIFQLKEKYEFYALADVLGSLATLSLIFLVVFLKLSLIFAVLAYLVGSLVRSVIALYLSSMLIRSFGFRVNFNLWRELLLSSWPIGLIVVFSQINSNIDKQVVYLANYNPQLHLIGAQASAIYSLAYRIFEVAIVVPNFVVNSVYPLLVAKKNLGTKALLNISRKLTTGLVILGLTASLAGFIISPFAVRILGSGSLPQASFTANILFLGLPLFFVSPLVLWLLIVLDQQKMAALIFALVTLFNLTANLVFVPKYGYNAAAVITILSELMILSLSFLILSLRLKNENN